MAVKIRLTRIGRHDLPFYRIVAADQRYSRDGRYLEQIGTYDPKKGLKEGANIQEEVALKWLATGAQYSDTIKAIFKANDLLDKANKGKVSENKASKAKVVKTKALNAPKKKAAKPAAKVKKASTTVKKGKTETAEVKTDATKGE
jgi:small subunit ribosomal protein S16